MKNYSVFAFLLLVLLVETVAPAAAQSTRSLRSNATQSQPRAQSSTQPRSAATNAAWKRPAFARGEKAISPSEVNNFFTPLRKPVALPDLPDLGNAKFRFGLERTRDNKTEIGQRYGTTSSPQQVIDFYKTSLSSQWKFSSISASNLTATKADREISVVIMPRGSSDVATDFMVNYSYGSR